MINVYVTNKWDKPLIDDYAYKLYSFPVGETVEIPIDVASYIFGYGKEDKEPVMARLSWIKTKNDIPEGMKILEKFEISLEPPQKNHSLSPVVERVPFPPAKRGGGKVFPKAA